MAPGGRLAASLPSAESTEPDGGVGAGRRS